jgi:transcription antitermination factor NusG
MGNIAPGLSHLVEEYISTKPVFRAPPSYRDHLVRDSQLQRDRAKKVSDPVAIDTDGVRWVAVRTMHASEWRVAVDLKAIGLRPYCPMIRKFVFRGVSRSASRSKTLIQQPVYARYLFVGLPPGRTVTRYCAEKIEGVLHDSSGPLAIPASGIAWINSQELAGVWDLRGPWKADASNYSLGETVRISQGPFAGFPACVDAITSENRIKAIVNIFGRGTPVELDCCQIEKT